jgi:4-azaleucine resistance transporter AzlC
MSIFVFAGSSQFIAVGMVAAGTGWVLVVLTTLIVNLRHLLYSVSLIPHVKNLPHQWKALLAFWLTDESFAVAIRRYDAGDRSPYKHWYYLGAAVFMYLNWQVCTLLGISIGQTIPNAADWGLDFAMSVTFIGMIVPYVKNKPMGIATLLAGAVAVLAYPLPHKLGLVLAAIAGISAGVISERFLQSAPTAR